MTTGEISSIEDARYLRALRDLAERRESIDLLGIPPLVAFHVVAALQLAALHPQMSDDLQPITRAFVAQIRGELAAINPVVGQLIDKGWVRDDPTPAPVAERTCRVCGCTDRDASMCIAKTGQPCWWVGADLCSACQGAAPR